jgi:hypothetical protein
MDVKRTVCDSGYKIPITVTVSVSTTRLRAQEYVDDGNEDRD